LSDFSCASAINHALRSFCRFCEFKLSAEEKWMEKSLMEAMRISLYLHGKVRIIHCGHCAEAFCAHNLKNWLKEQGPQQLGKNANDMITKLTDDPVSVLQPTIRD
jgi:hypothetical protein